MLLLVFRGLVNDLRLLDHGLGVVIILMLDWAVDVHLVHIVVIAIRKVLFDVIFELIFVELVTELQRVVLAVAAIVLILFFFVILVFLSDLDLWVFLKDLLTSHVELLEKEVGLSSSDHVIFFALNQLPCFLLEELLVLLLSLIDVVS